MPRALLAALIAMTAVSAAARQRPPLGAAEINDIALLLKLEDMRQLDEAALSRLLGSSHPEVRRRAAISVGRIANPQGLPLLDKVRGDRDVTVAASAVFAMGQLRQAGSVPWLSEQLGSKLEPVAREAARALGKITAPEARAALAAYLSSTTASAQNTTTIAEALLAIGRFSAQTDIAPIVRWTSSPDVDIAWSATWALFRPRAPAAAPHLLKLTSHAAPEVRYWAVRGLAPSVVDDGGLERPTVTARLRAAFLNDPDRRVKTEALRALLQFDDETAFSALVNGLYSPDTWISVSAAEAAARFASRGRVLAPLLVDVADAKAPIALKITVLPALVTLVPQATATLDLAVSLAKSDVGAARSAGFAALNRLGEDGQAKLKELAADPAMAGRMPQPGAGRGGGGGRANQPPREARPDIEYRQLVERFIVPDYNGAPKPRAVWETPKGMIELELSAGDAPFGTEHFIRVVESGDIVGTEFTRLVPNFVAQQQGIRNASTLRDEVSMHGLPRANLSWASAGLDTGRPGYTLGHTRQPHNEGNFTSLGRVVRGMEVVDKLELGDRIISAKMITAK